MKLNLFLPIVFSMLCVSSAIAEDTYLTVSDTAMIKEGKYSSLVKSALETYQELKSGAKSLDFAAGEKNAKCIVIFPSIKSGALIAGASHGDGVAFCKGSAAWSGVSFVDLYSGSIGLQAGADSTKAVLFLNSDEAKQELLDGKFNVAPTANALAGEQRAMLKGGLADERVTIISSQKGLFAGVNVTGTSIQIDESENKAFYKEPYELKTVLTTYKYSNPPGELEKIYTILP